MNDLHNNSKAAGRSKFELSESDRSRLVKQYEESPTSSGRTQYLRYLHGEDLTHKQAILAKCAECNSGYTGGRNDCLLPACPLYQFMPYRGQIKNTQTKKEVQQ